MAKTFIQLHGRTKVLKGRHGGNISRPRADVDDNIEMRIRSRVESRLADQLIDDCDIKAVAAEVMHPDVSKPQGINEMLFAGEAHVFGNGMHYDGEDVSVALTLDASGRVLSAHCKSWM